MIKSFLYIFILFSLSSYLSFAGNKKGKCGKHLSKKPLVDFLKGFHDSPHKKAYGFFEKHFMDSILDAMNRYDYDGQIKDIQEIIISTQKKLIQDDSVEIEGGLFSKDSLKDLKSYMDNWNYKDSAQGKSEVMIVDLSESVLKKHREGFLSYYEKNRIKIPIEDEYESYFLVVPENNKKVTFKLELADGPYDIDFKPNQKKGDEFVLTKDEFNSEEGWGITINYNRLKDDDTGNKFYLVEFHIDNIDGGF